MKANLIALLLCTGIQVFAQQKKLDFVPSGRSQHAAAFDSKKGLMLIFGGEKHYKNTAPSSLSIDNKLWAWDQSGWSSLSETGPSLRNDAKMVYHAQNGKTYLYGGRIINPASKVEVLAEFWEWDGNKWNLLSASAAPGRMLHTNLVYDPHRNRIVMFGGVNIDEKGFSNALWEWNGNNWQKIEAHNSPAPRIAHSMVYSPALKKTLIVGGVSIKDERFNEVWAWDGQNFELLDSHLPSIELGNYNAACMDEKGKQQMLLFGRSTKLAALKALEPGKNLSDTWIWDGTNWTKLELGIAPSLREGQSLVYDQKHKQVILFGGGAREEANYDNPKDLWVFKNGRWKAIKSE